MVEKDITKLKTLKQEDRFTTQQYNIYSYLQHKAKLSY